MLEGGGGRALLNTNQPKAAAAARRRVVVFFGRTQGGIHRKDAGKRVSSDGGETYDVYKWF